MKKIRLIYALGLTFILSSAGLLLWYGNVIENPGKKFNESGDGYKNYYTVEYHVLYDSTPWHFQGMNYPFGDNIIFTDNQPVLANFLRFIHQHHIFELKNKIVGILNLLIVFGIVLSAVFICLIFLELKIAWWYAAICAAAIAFLSPQLIRFSGHYALGYSFYIPMLIFIWYRYFKMINITGSLLISAIIILASFIHLYYLPMAMILGTGLWIMHYMKHRPGILVTVSNFFIQIILPLILVTFWIDSLDSIKDRPELPYGFMEYKAFWNGIFLPDLWRISSFLQTHFDRIHVLNIENVSYIGMAADVFIILILIHFIYKIADKNANTIVLVADEFLNNLLITAFFILLFSFGLPFIIHTNWLKYTGRFQQFRSVGRFAWIFFYIINIYLFAWSYTNWTRRKTTFSHIILMLPVLLLLTDNLLMHRKMYVGNEKADKAMISETRIPFKPDQYQAILPFPFFFYGGEGFGIDDNCENIVNTEQLSLATGLPMIASNMDRTSAAQVIKNIAYSKNDHLPINVYKEYLSKKPILIMRANNCNIGPRESQLILKSIFVARSDKYTYYALYPDSIGKFNESLQEKRSLPN